MLDAAHEHDDHDDQSQGQVVVRLGVEHAELQLADMADVGRVGDAGDAARAAESVGVGGGHADDLAEAEGDDGQVVAPQPQGGRSEDHPGHGGGGDGRRQDHPEAPALLGPEQGHGVGADGEEGDVAEVEEAGLADHHVEADGEQHVHGDGEEQDALPVAGGGHDPAHGVAHAACRVLIHLDAVDGGKIHGFARADHALRQSGDFTIRHASKEHSHEERRHLVVRDFSAGIGVDQVGNLFRKQFLAVTLPMNQINCTHG